METSAQDEINAYLQKYNFKDVLEDLVNLVLIQKPEDPFKALAQLLINKSETSKLHETPGPTKRAPIPGECRGGFEIKTTRRVYENPWIEVREDQVIRADGKDGIYGVVTMKNWALGVVPYFSDGTIMLVGQHRYPHNDYSWEIPEGGGKIGVDPLEEIKRELREETGIHASKWTPLGPVHTSNCVVDETGYLWLAEESVEGKADPDGDEVLRTRRIPLLQAVKEIQTGKIFDSMTVIAIYKTVHLLQSRDKKMSLPAFDPTVVSVPVALAINEGPIKRLLTWWFGHAESIGSYKSMGFERNAETDQIIREKFESDWKMASLGRYDDWDESPDGCLAKVILCGVVSRRLHRDALAYGTDGQAIKASKKLLEIGADKKLSAYQRMYVYLALGLQETLEAQQKSVQLLETLLKESSSSKLEANVKIAREKLSLFEKFGRFPNRNAMLKRDFTKEEEEYVKANEGRIHLCSNCFHLSYDFPGY